MTKYETRNTHHIANKRTLRWGVVIALLLVAFAMRVAWLADIPPGLHHDEAIYSAIAEKALAGEWSIFYPEGQGREGFYTPFLAAALKWLGTGAFALRVPSVFLSILGLCAVYALARRLFGSFVAAFALAEMSVTFWTVFPGRVAMRAVTEPLVAALAAWALWRAISNVKCQVSNFKSGAFAIAGGLIGLTVYTYRGARALPVIVVLLPFYLALFDRTTLKRIWRGLVVCAAVAAVIAAPLVIFLAAHPGIDQLDWAGRDQVLQALRAGDVRPALETTAATLGAFFVRGDPDDYYNLQGRPIFEPVTGALFAVGLLIALWRIREHRYAYVPMWFVLALAPGMVSQPAPHFYRIIGVQVTAFMLPGIALAEIRSRLLASRPSRRLAAALAGCVVLLLIADGVWNAHDYFVTWGHKEAVRVLWNQPMAEIARYLDRSDEQTPVAVCTLLVNRSEPWLRPAPDFFHFLMRRDSTSLRFYDCRYSLVFPADGGETRYAFPGTAPADQFVSRLLMPWLGRARPIEGTVLSPDNALLRLEVKPTLDDHLARIAAIEGTSDSVEWGHMVEWKGYQVLEPRRRGQPILLLTWWRVRQGPLPPSLTLFTHLLQGERILAQQDLLSVMADTLEPGDVFVQVHEFVVIPADAPPGDYSLVIGLYDATTGKRLTIYRDGAPAGDRLTLETIHLP
jgi:4-amino-4-deoxy-L-arabinose transferase-like glycosyltransferase